MTDISRADAEAICAACKTAPSSSWVSHSSLEGVSVIAVGVMDAAGNTLQGMFVELRISSRRTPVIEHWVFTLCREHYPHPMDRIYQLDIRQVRRRNPRMSDHDKCHEHIGKERIPGPANWDTISFDEALNIFQNRTNLTFDGPIHHPQHFELTKS